MNDKRRYRQNEFEKSRHQGTKFNLRLSDGVFKSLNPNFTRTFKEVWGHLEGIYQQSTTHGNSKRTFWYIDLRYGETLYSVRLPYHSTFFKEIVLALARDESLGTSSIVEIIPSMEHDRLKAIVRCNNRTIGCSMKELPPLFTRTEKCRNENVQEQMEYISRKVGEINRKVV